MKKKSQPQIEADLHFHSVFSDGFVELQSLAKKIMDKNMVLASLTDHDTVAGVAPLASILGETSVQLISGTELSCEFQNRELHVIGYFIDVSSARLLERLAFFAHQRTERFKRMLEKLSEMNVVLDFDEIHVNANKAVLGRPHLAKALVEKKFCATQEEAYIRFIGNRAAAYVRKYRFPLNEAADLIHQVGGVAIIAHPGLYKFKEAFIRAAIEVGVDGIEIFHPKHSAIQQSYYLKLAQEAHLMTTGGSDFHGTGRSDDCELGTCGISVELLRKSRFLK